MPDWFDLLGGDYDIDSLTLGLKKVLMWSLSEKLSPPMVRSLINFNKPLYGRLGG